MLSEATFDPLVELPGGSNQGTAIFTIEGGSGRERSTVLAMQH